MNAVDNKKDDKGGDESEMRELKETDEIEEDKAEEAEIEETDEYRYVYTIFDIKFTYNRLVC